MMGVRWGYLGSKPNNKYGDCAELNFQFESESPIKRVFMQMVEAGGL